MLTVVQNNNMKAVHQLSLILVNPLYLDIKYGVDIDLNIILSLDEVCKSYLVFLYNDKISKPKFSHCGNQMNSHG